MRKGGGTEVAEPQRKEKAVAQPLEGRTCGAGSVVGNIERHGAGGSPIQ